MRRFLLLFIAALLLIAAPVFGQSAPPISTPTAPEAQAWEKVLNALQKLSESNSGSGNFITIVVALSMLGVILTILFLANKFGSPFLKFVTTAQANAEIAHTALMQRIEVDDAKDRGSTMLEIQRTASISQLAGATQKIVDDIETRQQSEDRGKREVGVIKEHVTNDGNLTRADVKKIVDKLEEADQETKKAATRDDLQQIVEPIQQGLNELLALVRAAEHQVATGEPGAVSAPTPDPANPPSSSKLPGIPLN